MGNKRYIRYSLLLLVICILFTGKAYAKDIKSMELIDNAKEYDGKQITYSGEVIGDIMKRGNFAWVNVSDGDNAVGIWIPYVEAKKISYTGSYAYKGDIVRVVGIFNRACAEHGGDFDIHSSSIEVLQKGSKTVRYLDRKMVYAALGLLSASVIMITLIIKKHI